MTTIAELGSQISWNDQGLVPAIIQDESDGRVLMMAWMSFESLAKTFELGETVFFSRSRNELWHKGATSGNTQAVSKIEFDCDSDSLLIQVSANGPACHTGKNSCFDAGVVEVNR